MKIKEFHISGPKLIDCMVIPDGRGFFCERNRADLFEQAGLPTFFPQENQSRSAHRVLRGLHYQYDKPQGKLVTCMAGEILDCIVDIRKKSPTYGESLSFTLRGDQPQWLWIPPGFAHGFCITSKEGADILYKVTEYYNPKGEGGIMWNEKHFALPWPVEDPVLSKRDSVSQSFADYDKSPMF